jgi:hypothetical protein
MAKSKPTKGKPIMQGTAKAVTEPRTREVKPVIPPKPHSVPPNTKRKRIFVNQVKLENATEKDELFAIVVVLNDGTELVIDFGGPREPNPCNAASDLGKACELWGAVDRNWRYEEKLSTKHAKQLSEERITPFAANK